MLKAPFTTIHSFLLADKAAWTKRHYAAYRNSRGYVISNPPTPNCWCLSGLIRLKHSPRKEDMFFGNPLSEEAIADFALAANYICKYFPGVEGNYSHTPSRLDENLVIAWNDYPATTIDEVLALTLSTGI